MSASSCYAKTQVWLNALGVGLTLVMFICAANQLMLDLTPFSVQSMQYGFVTLLVVLFSVWLVRRLSCSPSVPLLLPPLFLVATGNLVPLLAWLTFIGATILLGSWLTTSIPFLRPLRSGLTELGASIAIGMPANSALIWAAMHLPVNYSGTYWALLLGQSLVLCLFAPQTRPELKIAWSPGQLALLAYALMILPYAVVPSYNYDDLTSHLFIPRQTQMFGEFEFSPLFAPGLSPCLIPIGSFTALFLLGGENAVRLLQVSLFVFSFAAIEVCARHYWGPRVALLAILFAALSPYTCWMVGIVFTDSTLLLAATFLLIFSIDFLKRPSALQLPGIGLLAGLGYLAKQQMIFLLVPLAIPLAFLTLRLFAKEPATTLKNLLLACLLCIGVLAPPLIHNYVLSGNPIFPFYNAVFRSPYWPPENLKDGRWSQPFGIKALWNITFDGSKFIENIRYAFGFSALVFAPLLLLRCFADVLRKQYAAVLLVLCAIGYAFVAHKVTGLYMRYLVGLIPPLSLALGIAVAEAAARSRLTRGIVYPIVGLVLAANFAVFLSIRNMAEPYPVLSALTGSVEGSTMEYHHHFKRLFRSAGKRFGRQSLGLLVDSPAGYFAETRIVSNAWFYPTLSIELKARAKPEELFDFIFREQGIRYIVMPREAGSTGFGDPVFRRRLRLVGKTADFGLYVPRDGDEPPSTPGSDAS